MRSSEEKAATACETSPASQKQVGSVSVDEATKHSSEAVTEAEVPLAKQTVVVDA